MKLNFNFDGKTLLKKWWQIVRDNFTTIQTDHNNLQTAHDTLSNKVSQEIKDRQSDTSSLTGKINTEIQQRQSADNALQRSIDTETANRQSGDSELQTKIDTETSDRKTADGELNGKKADKTELYGTDETTVHTVTYSLTAADLVVAINSAYSTGTVTIAGDTVKNKILLDGHSIQAAELSETFACDKGDSGDKYINISYEPTTGMLNMEIVDVETSPESGTIALMTVGYNTATVTTMYNRSQTYSGINNLSGLKTNDKNSFLAAVNEIFDTVKTASDSVKTAVSKAEQAEATAKSASDATGNITVDMAVMQNGIDDHTNARNNPHQVTAEQIGLGNVKNTSDMDKPISTATQTALNGKAPTSHASSGTTYGVGSGINYGHLKLSNSINSAASTDGGVAATPYAVKTAYDKAVSAYDLANDAVDHSTDAYSLAEKIADNVRSTTIVVGAADSKYHSEDIPAIDYICTGTNDQTTIQSAIGALPSTGGKIVLLDGTFNIGGQIAVNKANVTIVGMGNSTVLNRKFDSTADNIGVITVSADNCTISSFKINGNKTTYTSTKNIGICVQKCKYSTVKFVTIDNESHGIKLYSNVFYAKIIGNTITNGYIGIYSDYLWDSIIAFNQIDTMSNNCIMLDWTSTRNMLICNRCASATNCGIYVTSNSVNTTVIGNHCYFSHKNISINSGYNLIANNFCKQTGDSSTSDYSIVIESSGSNNLIANNLLFFKNYVNNGGTTNTFTNNKYS